MTTNRSTAVALAALALQGCAIVSSVPAGRGGEGIAYMLPRALLPIDLVFDGVAYELRVAPAMTTGDTAHTYALQRSGNIFTSENYVVTVDPATGLLTTINLTSVDHTLAILRREQPAEAETARIGDTGQVVHHTHFDPGSTTGEIAKFNTRLLEIAKNDLERRKRDSGCGEAASTDPCKGLIALGEVLKNQTFGISVDNAPDTRPAQTDCSAGFCYRMNVPHVVTLSGPAGSLSTVLGLPNRSPTFVMPLERWAFVKTTHNVTLDKGVFQSITTDRPSSAMAIASAPVDAARAMLGAVGEVVQLRIDTSGREKAQAQTRIAEIEAKAAGDRARLDKGLDPPGTAKAAAPAASAAPLLSIRIAPAGR